MSLIGGSQDMPPDSFRPQDLIWCFLKHKIAMIRTDTRKSAVREISLAMHSVGLLILRDGQEPP